MEEGRSRSELGVVDTVGPELGSETCVGPGEVWGGCGLLVLGLHKADELRQSALKHNAGADQMHLVPFGLVVRLEVSMLTEPVSHLRVVPRSPDGRLDSSVIFVEELLVLFLLKLRSIVTAKTVSAMTPLLLLV